MASGSGPVFLITIDKSEASEEVFNCKSEHHYYTRPVADPGFPRQRRGVPTFELGVETKYLARLFLKTATDNIVCETA